MTAYCMLNVPDDYRFSSVRIAPCRWCGHTPYLLHVAQKNTSSGVYLLSLIGLCIGITWRVYDSSGRYYTQIPIAPLQSLTALLTSRGFVHRIL